MRQLSCCAISTILTLAQSVASGQSTVVISEFMASNQTSLIDGDGNYSDWIELHNFGAETVDLSGWFLTDRADDLKQWKFPAGALESGGYLIVFASSNHPEDGVDATGQLHTNFRLSAQGEYLALVGSDGISVISEFAPTYPVQTTDVSYGNDTDRARSGFFETPTPGAANRSLASLGKTVTFSRSGGTFSDSLDITVTADLGEGQQIRYTTNGQLPTLFNSTNATSGDTITITKNTHLRAHVVENGGLTGPSASAIFLKIANDLTNFSSNLPVVVIDTAGKTIPPTSSATLVAARTLIFEPDLISGRANFGLSPHYSGNSGLRIRGRSSSGFPKNQYNFEFWDDEANEKNFNLLGMGGESDWVLSAPYTDKSLMRNVITYRLWQDAGWPSLDTRFVEVFINQDGDNEISFSDDYLGVYVFIEGITIDDDRLDIEPPEETTDPGQITGGYVMESGNPEGAHFSTRTSKKSIPYRHKDPNRDELNAEQRTWIKTRIEDFEKALFADDFRHPDTGVHYRELTNMDSQVDYKIYREWTRNFDGGSTFFHIPRGGVIIMGPLWDYNWALGNVNYAEGGDDPGYFTAGWNRSFTSLPSWSSWSLRMEDDPIFWHGFTERWLELREEILSTERVNAIIDETAALLEESAARNFVRWKVLGVMTFISPPGFRDRKTYQSEVDYLKQWLADRMAWMDGAFVTKPSLSQPGGSIVPNFELTMSSPDGSVVFTADGSDPRSPDGTPSPSAIQFAGGPVDVVFIAAGSDVRYLVPTDDALGDAWRQPDFDDTHWPEAPSPLGFETPGGPIEAAIGTDIKADMRGVNASIYVRHTFNLNNDPTNVNSLRMALKYDDTFVAWLNGVEIARDADRTPASVTWNSYATDSRSDDDAVKDFVIDLGNHRDKMRRGPNVLAIQAMNTAAGSSDFLIGATLDGNHTVSSEPLVLNDSTLIKARTRQADRWSAAVSAYFWMNEVPADAGNLVLSEIMYHPPAPTSTEIDAGFVDREQFEFIEIHNISSETVRVFNLAFIDGIDFDFTKGNAASIAPGGYAVIVQNKGAFEARYGAGITIIGEFADNLANGGERLELAGVLAIDYDDNWHPSTDGEGFSLNLIDESNVRINWSQSGTWRASSTILGSPGAGDGNSASGGGFSQWLKKHFSPAELKDPAIAGFDADPDHDLLSNLYEYAANSHPRSADGVGIPEPLAGEFAGVRYRRAAAANDVAYSVEHSTDLTTWMPVTNVTIEETDNGEGSISVSATTEIRVNGSIQQFLRIHVALVPDGK
ncbi:MAG: CotH kinase family protein [Verrucomicrobia bacterium]|nr:CotH kinase family protein [Verrucomicrobiota bacterium]